LSEAGGGVLRSSQVGAPGGGKAAGGEVCTPRETGLPGRLDRLRGKVEGTAALAIKGT